MSRPRLTALAMLLLAAPSASAQQIEDAPTVVEKAAKPRLEATGRIFVRETVSDEGGGDVGAQTSIASARLGLRYQREHLRAAISVELRKSAKLRSAYIHVAPVASLGVRAGLFKIPLSSLELTSSWVLPVADRGVISTILTDRLQVAGRRVGAEAAWTPGERGGADDAWRFSARAGYFQGLDDLGELLDGAAADAFGKVGAVRVELGPFGASAQLRQGRPELFGPTRTAWATSMDATVELAGLRLWGEATLGSSWLVAEPTRQETLFFETRGVAAWRAGGAKGGAAYIEPYVLLGLVDPDARLADDLVLEGTAGINAGVWKRWRFQLELEIWRFGNNVPMGFVAPSVVPVARTAVVAQLGASF